MMPTTFLIVVVAVLLGALPAFGRGYAVHEQVPVVVNTVGPFSNPAETYKYYSLPFCKPKEQFGQEGNLGEVLAGDRRRNSLYDVRYQVDTQWQALCHFKLTQDEIKKFMDAIEQHYIFEMFIDDLGVKGFVGEVEESVAQYDHHSHQETHTYLFTHLDFSIAYNENNVIACNLTTDPSQRVELRYGSDIDVEFSFSTRWVHTPVPYVDRMELHSKSAIGDQALEIHWLSIINSFVLVVLLTAFLALILMRVLKKDFARYMELDDEEFDDGQDDSGWKLVHGDVFRTPDNIMLFSAAVGTGTQMLVLVVSILILSLVGTFYPGNRGAIYTSAVVLYALTAGVAGYTSTSLYVSLGGDKWATNSVLTACLFTVPFCMVFCVVNTVAVSYGSSTALPFGTIFVIILLLGLVSFPLTVIGSMRGRSAEPYDAPCKTNKVAREIPPVPFYRRAPIQMFIAGFLPFSAIYIELHYIFAAIYGHRVYTLFGILALAFLMLVIVTAFITIALTYFQLAVEDYHWWWRSFLSGSSTGVFMYGYAIFYYNYRAQMSGALQGAYFFGYMFTVSYAFALMLGAIGFFCAKGFVRHIYLSIKID